MSIPGWKRCFDVETARPLIAALPEQQRTVLVFRFFDDMTQDQIAERVGYSQMHVSRLLAGRSRHYAVRFVNQNSPTPDRRPNAGSELIAGAALVEVSDFLWQRGSAEPSWSLSRADASA